MTEGRHHLRRRRHQVSRGYESHARAEWIANLLYARVVQQQRTPKPRIGIRSGYDQI